MADERSKDSGYIRDTVDLRKWCVEQALKWPQNPAAVRDEEINITGLAERIKDWVVAANKKPAE